MFRQVGFVGATLVGDDEAGSVKFGIIVEAGHDRWLLLAGLTGLLAEASFWRRETDNYLFGVITLLVATHDKVLPIVTPIFFAHEL